MQRDSDAHQISQRLGQLQLWWGAPSVPGPGVGPRPSGPSVYEGPRYAQGLDELESRVQVGLGFTRCPDIPGFEIYPGHGSLRGLGFRPFPPTPL